MPPLSPAQMGKRSCRRQQSSGLSCCQGVNGVEAAWGISQAVEASAPPSFASGSSLFGGRRSTGRGARLSRSISRDYWGD